KYYKKKSGINSGLFHLFNNPQDARNALMSGKVWTVLGGGGWLMPSREVDREDHHLEAILPKEQGAFIWVDCCSVLKNTDAGDVNIDKVMKNLLESKAQLRFLDERMPFLAFPAANKALSELKTDSKYKRFVDDFNIAQAFANWEEGKEPFGKLSEK